jgi:hypothetical protein
MERRDEAGKFVKEGKKEEEEEEEEEGMKHEK